MRHYMLLCLASLLSIGTIGQEFKFYLNGSNIKDSTFENFSKGDLLRVVFSNKTTPYNFRIASILITLTPIKNIEGSFAGNTTSFLLDNTNTSYTGSPTFTVDLYERLTLLKYNEYNISVTVKQLFSDTPEGSDWILEHIKFEEVHIRKRLPTGGK